MAKAEIVKAITPEGRVSFPKVFEKSDFSGKYELTLIFPKGTDLTKLKKMAMDCAVAKWGKQLPAGLRSPFRKCAEKPETYGEAFDPEDVFITFRSMNIQPGLVDATVEPIIDQKDFYPGCWARVSTNVYAYETKGNKGLAFGLGNIQKTRDDDPLSAMNRKPEDEFEALETAAPVDNDIFDSGDLPTEMTEEDPF